MISPTQLRKELSGIITEFSDGSYTAIDHFWLINDFRKWWEQYLFDNNIKWIPETFDCENFSRLLIEQVNLSGALAGLIGVSPVIGTYKINRPDTSLHMKCVVRTNRGWFEIEPQDSEDEDKFVNKLKRSGGIQIVL